MIWADKIRLTLWAVFWMLANLLVQGGQQAATVGHLTVAFNWGWLFGIPAFILWVLLRTRTGGRWPCAAPSNQEAAAIPRVGYRSRPACRRPRRG
jgi:hypothetical protein